MTLGFLSSFRNFCKLLWGSCEVLFSHGYAWIHRVAKSCTTTAYRWLFRASQLSMRTLWSAVIKSPKFSARSTAPPLRLLHGALVILVLLQISQLRSLGKWVLTQCLPKSSRLLNVGSKDTSRAEMAWESPCTGFSSSTKISLNSCSHSGISELAWLESAYNGSSRSILLSTFFGRKFLVGLVHNGLPRSIINIGNWHRHWRGITFSSILFFSSLIITWWRRWWRRRAWGRCRTRPLLSWRCLWSWMIRSGGRTRWQAWNHDRNEVLRVALYTNPVFMRCGFWPLIHS